MGLMKKVLSYLKLLVKSERKLCSYRYSLIYLYSTFYSCFLSETTQEQYENKLFFHDKIQGARGLSLGQVVFVDIAEPVAS